MCITTNSNCAATARVFTKSPMTCSRRSTRAECETEQSPFSSSTLVAASSSWKMPTQPRDTIWKSFRPPRARKCRLLHARCGRRRRHALTYPHGPDAHQRDHTGCGRKNSARNVARCFPIRTSPRIASAKSSDHHYGRMTVAARTSMCSAPTARHSSTTGVSAPGIHAARNVSAEGVIH